MNFLRTLAQNPGKAALSIAAAAGISHGLTQAGQWQAVQDQVLIDAPYTPNTVGPVAAPPSFYVQRFGTLPPPDAQGFSHPMKNPFINNPGMDFYARRSLSSGEKMGRIFAEDAGWTTLLGSLAWGAWALIQRGRRRKAAQNNVENRKAVSNFVNDNLTAKHSNHATFLNELNTFLDRYDLLQGWNTKQTHYLLTLILKKITTHLDQNKTPSPQENNLADDIRKIDLSTIDMTDSALIRNFLTVLKDSVNDVLNPAQVLIADEANRGNPAIDPTESTVLNAQTPFAEFHALTTYGGPNAKYGLNEDSAAVTASGDGIAVVVTDGAGGEGISQQDSSGNWYKGGYAAGKTATQTIVDSLRGNPDLATALKAAHAEVLKSQTGGKAAVAVVHVNKALTINAARVGDTQILIVRNGEVFFRSIPQNWAWLFNYIFQQVPDLAKVYESDVANVVDYLLGFTPGKDVAPLNLNPQATHDNDLKEYSRFYFDPIQGEVGDQVLLMSDGVIDNVSEYEILGLAKQFRGEELAQKIRQLALERNNTTDPKGMITIQLDQNQTVEKKVTRDNITVGVLELKPTEIGTDMGDGGEEENQGEEEVMFEWVSSPQDAEDGKIEFGIVNEAPVEGTAFKHPLSVAKRKALRHKYRKGSGGLSTMKLPIDLKIAKVSEVRNPTHHNENEYDDWLPAPTNTSPITTPGTRPPDSDEDWDIVPAASDALAPVVPQGGDEIVTLELDPNLEIAVASGVENIEIDLTEDPDGSVGLDIDLTPAAPAEADNWLDVIDVIDSDPTTNENISLTYQNLHSNFHSRRTAWTKMDWNNQAIRDLILEEVKQIFLDYLDTLKIAPPNSSDDFKLGTDILQYIAFFKNYFAAKVFAESLVNENPDRTDIIALAEYHLLELEEIEKQNLIHGLVVDQAKFNQVKQLLQSAVTHFTETMPGPEEDLD